MTAALLPVRTFPALTVPRLPRPDLARDALLITGVVVGLAQSLGLGPWATDRPFDSFDYWKANLDNLFPGAYTAGDFAYVYPPPMAQAIAPLHVLGYGLYQTLLTTALFAALWYCAGRWSWPLLGLGLVAYLTPGLGTTWTMTAGAVLGYTLNGNVELLLAAAVAMSIRHPGSWAAALLTKPTMGIGVLWFVFRGEWRRAATAIGVTALIAGVSFALAPNLWFEFVSFSLRNAAMSSNLPVVPISLPVRVAMSVALLAWGARTDRRWTIAIAAAWAIPLLYVGSYVAIWVAAIRLSGAPNLRHLWVDRPLRPATLAGIDGRWGRGQADAIAVETRASR